MSEDDIRSDRLRKLTALNAAGMTGYPSKTGRDTSVANFLQTFDEREQRETKQTIAGRVMSLRGQGGILFARIFDGTGANVSDSNKAQIVLQKAEMDEDSFALFTSAVDIGDFIEATGLAFKTKRGERSLKVASWNMLAKSLRPIPDGWYGLKDQELILRQRYLDMLVNDDVRAMFVRRSKFWQAAREFYLSRGFLEVETPILENTPGGADARPFKTHHNALDTEVYLRISAGELWQKELLIGGYQKVFEIGRIFRNEGQSREHLQDYTQLESYEAFSDATEGMKFVQELYRHIVKETYGQFTFTIGDHTVDFAEDWTKIDFCTAIKDRYGIDPITCTNDEAIQAAKEAGVKFGEAPNKSRAVDHLWKIIRKSAAGPSFLIGVPVYLEPLAKRMDGNEQVVDRFQVVLAGSEMGKGYSELNDPIDQRERFEEQQKLRDAGDDEAQRLDEEYVRAMEYGMPPAFGFGVSERLFSFLENRPAHEAQMFPLLRPRPESA